jgi:hypothetical protein
MGAMRRAALLAALLLAGCDPAGREGFFVELYGRVVDEHDLAAAGVDVTVTTGESALMGEAVTDESGWYRLPVFVEAWTGHTVRLRAEGSGWAPTEAWTGVDLTEGEAHLLSAAPPQTWTSWSRQLPPLRIAYDDPLGSAQGLLVDATSGDPVEDADIEVRYGWNAPDDEAAVGTVRTGHGGDAGAFQVADLPPGAYTGRVPEAAGYGDSRFPLFLAARDPWDGVVAVSRPLSGDEMRASLVWAASPADLDLHITGPRATVQTGEDEWERFHVWAGAPYHPADASDAHERIVEMERTDADGEGPETVVVREVHDTGTYRFSAFDVQAGEGSEDLSLSRAVIQVWAGGQDPAFFEITPGLEGNAWTAAEQDPATGVTYRYQDVVQVDDEGDAEAF